MMLEALAVPAINRLLRANAWALDKLRPHAGKAALFTSAPFELKFMVTETGELRGAPREMPAATTVAVTPGVLLRFAARDESAWNAAQVSGDMDFAAAIDYVRRNLSWDYEEDLAYVFGDIGAHRLGRVVRELDRWGRATVFNLGQAFVEYSTHEQPVLASARAVELFNSEVDEVRDQVSRLEKRIQLVSQRLSGTGTA
jgi:ubiquinone biosynthesis protein UbiJ